MKFFKISTVFFGLILTISPQLQAIMTFINQTNEVVWIRVSCAHGSNFPNSWTAGKNQAYYWNILNPNDKISYRCPIGTDRLGRPDRPPTSSIIFGRLVAKSWTQLLVDPVIEFEIEDIGASNWYINPNGCVYLQQNFLGVPASGLPFPQCLQRWKK